MGEVTLLNWLKNTELTLHELGSHQLVTYNRNDDLLAALSSEGTVQVWDIQTEELLFQESGMVTHGSDLEFNGQGTVLATIRDGAIHLWGVRSEQGDNE